MHWKPVLERLAWTGHAFIQFADHVYIYSERAGRRHILELDGCCLSAIGQCDAKRHRADM